MHCARGRSMSKLYLSVPVEAAIPLPNNDSTEPAQMQPKDVEMQSRVGDAVRVLMGKTEVEADPEKLKQQVVGYISLIRGAIAETEENEGRFRVSSVKLGLTVTVGGNIGVASAGAEASIEVEFSRSG